MAKVQKIDRIQFAEVFPIETVANNGNTVQFPTGMTNQDRVGILIHQVEYDFSGVYLALLAAAADQIHASLHQIQTQNGVTSGRLGLISHMHIDFVAAAGGISTQPWKIRFDEPVLAHPAALYGTVCGQNLAAVVAGRIRIGFTYVDLAEADYVDLWQTILMPNLI